MRLPFTKARQVECATNRDGSQQPNGSPEVHHQFIQQRPEVVQQQQTETVKLPPPSQYRSKSPAKYAFYKGQQLLEDKHPEYSQSPKEPFIKPAYYYQSTKQPQKLSSLPPSPPPQHFYLHLQKKMTPLTTTAI